MADRSWAELRRDADEGTRPLPDADYIVTVASATATQASTGSEMIKLVLRVTSGPQAGRSLWTNFVLSPDNAFALQRFFRNLEAFGLDGRYLDTEPPMEKIAADLVNRSAVATVGSRLFQGAPRNEITALRSTGSAGAAGTGPVVGQLTGVPGVPTLSPGVPVISSPAAPRAVSVPAPPQVTQAPTTPTTPTYPVPPPVPPTDPAF